MNLKNKKVLLVDADPQGNATSGLGIRKDTGFSTYDVLINEVEIPNVIQKVELKNLKNEKDIKYIQIRQFLEMTRGTMQRIMLKNKERK